MEYSEQGLTQDKIDALTTDELIVKALDYLSKYDACELTINELKAKVKLDTEDQKQIRLLENSQDELICHYWDILRVLHTRGSDTEFQYCKKLAESSLANERILAADILGQLCYQDQDKFYDFAVTKLIELLDDNDDDVVASAATCLGHRVKKDSDFRAIAKLTNLAHHSNKHIRSGVTFALGSVEHPEAIKTLIKLCDDKEVEVKDWAVFSLGSLIETDTPEIRATLKKALEDEDIDVRGEALVGLAERGDDSILDKLKQELEGEYEASYAIIASELLADASLLPYLEAMKKQYKDEMVSYHLSRLEDAIKACSKIEQ